MKLPHPREQLAGCCWLPRLAAKTRVYFRGEMPLSYRVALGSPIGIDGYFFRHFRLSRRQVMAAIRAAPDDEALGAWFLARPTVTGKSIADWNEFAPRIGSSGNPGRVTWNIVKWFLYPKIAWRPIRSLFEGIVLDENLAEPERPQRPTPKVSQ